MKSNGSTNIKRVVLINDLSCFGNCSITVALPIIASYGIEAVPLPTAILSTHTSGFEGYTVLDMTSETERIIRHWKTIGLRFDGIYTGYFRTPEQIRMITRWIRECKDKETFLLVDPVMGDAQDLYTGLTQEHVSAMRELCAIADVITPNRTEAAMLADMPATAETKQLLDNLPASNAIITGVPFEDEIGYLARINGEILQVSRKRLEGILYGAGDVFAARLCAGYMRGDSLKTAFFDAAEFCEECIRQTEKVGSCHKYGLAYESVLKERK